MSRETTLAAADVRHQETAWKSHRQHCPRCSGAARSRQWDGLCASGTEIRHAIGRARQDLADSRELDRQPVTGQGSLF
jgi:hypothetical protein